MKSLIITDVAGTIRVEYVTDLINASARNFSVMDIKGLTPLAITSFGLTFQKKPYKLQDFEAFCTTAGLNLFMVDYRSSAPQPFTTVVSAGYLYGPALGSIALG